MNVTGINVKSGPIIKEVIITPIAIVDPPLLNAAGLHAPYALRTIVEIITDDNITGIVRYHETQPLTKHLSLRDQ